MIRILNRLGILSFTFLTANYNEALAYGYASISGYTSNPFEYQNEIFKQLFNLDEELYFKVNYDLSTTSNNHDATIKLKLEGMDNISVYGNIPWDYEANTQIYVNDNFITNYACWKSPSVFYIPYESDTECIVEVKSEGNFNWDNIEIYALNLDVLKKCSELAWQNSSDDLSVSNSNITLNVEGSGDERLFVSVASDDGWNIKVNECNQELELIADCLYSIKLENGDNTLVMKYKVKYQTVGTILSFVSLVSFTLYICIRKNIHLFINI